MKIRFSSKSLTFTFLLLILFAFILLGNSIQSPSPNTPGVGIASHDSQVTQSAPTPTSPPVDLGKNKSQTQGIVVGMVILVTIIIAGTLTGITRRQL